MIILGIYWWEFLKVAIKFESSGLNGLTPCLIMEMANILFLAGLHSVYEVCEKGRRNKVGENDI